MYNVWVLNLRAQPPTVEAHVQAKDFGTLKKACQVMAATFSGPEYTMVHEVNASPLDITES